VAEFNMVAEQQYYFAGRDQKPEYVAHTAIIGDELADIFAQIIRVADYYKIDLVEAHMQARRAEDEDLSRRGVYDEECGSFLLTGEQRCSTCHSVASSGTLWSINTINCLCSNYVRNNFPLAMIAEVTL
jgi:hypothetical protein